MLFHCKNITKYYYDEPVVQDINIELPSEGFISLVGPSGTGKTTLFNILAGVDKPDLGSVFLGEENITGVTGRVSYMLQKDLLLEYRTVIDNVILPLLIHGEKKKPAREKAAAFFPMFGLENCEKKYPNELSGGMRQRAALLRTFLTSGKINVPAAEQRRSESPPPVQVILLDEPFSALDAITRRKMQTWYSSIALQMKASTLFITHDVEEALSLSDTVYILNGKPGKITHKIDVTPHRPRDFDFTVSKEFAEQKKSILEAIGDN